MCVCERDRGSTSTVFGGFLFCSKIRGNITTMNHIQQCYSGGKKKRWIRFSLRAVKGKW